MNFSFYFGSLLAVRFPIMACELNDGIEALPNPIQNQLLFFSPPKYNLHSIWDYWTKTLNPIHLSWWNLFDPKSTKTNKQRLLSLGSTNEAIDDRSHLLPEWPKNDDGGILTWVNYWKKKKKNHNNKNGNGPNEWSVFHLTTFFLINSQRHWMFDFIRWFFMLTIESVEDVLKLFGLWMGSQN